MLIALSGRELWDPDEPRFAVVAREMLERGDWIVPHFNGEPLALLPPLTYWTSALASLPVGDVTPWSARAGVAAFALLALAATALFDGASAGAWAALVLLASAKFLHQAQYLQADMLLVGAQTSALVAFWRAYTTERHRVAWLAAAYVAVALGMLAKGPLGALLPGAVFGIFLLWQRDLRALGRLGIVWGVPLVAVLIAPWYVAACSRGGEAFCRELVLRQNFEMFFDTWSHARPVWYYAVQLPWMFLPWTLVLPFALRGVRLTSGDTRLLCVWIAFSFVFFSASEAKQSKYLLAIAPPLAILVGRWIASSDLRSRRAATAVGAFLGAAVLTRWIAAPRADAFKLPLALTERAAALGHPVAVHGISWRQLGGLVYYGQRELPRLASQPDLAAWMSAPEPRLAYVDRKDWDGKYELVAASDYRGGTVLVANGWKEVP